MLKVFESSGNYFCCFYFFPLQLRRCLHVYFKERPEKEVTEEPKKFMTQEMARGFSLFEEAL